MPDSHARPAPRILRPWLAAAALSLAAACGGGPAGAPAETIDPETFIATYVDLRAAAVRADGGRIDADGRAAILARHGVSEEDLLEFASSHGEDVATMRRIWDEVERRLDALRLREDSVGTQARDSVETQSRDPGEA